MPRFFWCRNMDVSAHKYIISQEKKYVNISHDLIFPPKTCVERETLICVVIKIRYSLSDENKNKDFIINKYLIFFRLSGYVVLIQFINHDNFFP